MKPFCAVLTQFVTVGAGLVNLITEWLEVPGEGGTAPRPMRPIPADLKLPASVGGLSGLIDMFARGVQAVRKAMVFEDWLRAGGRADQQALERRSARLARRAAARAAARAAEPAGEAPAREADADAPGSGSAGERRRQRLNHAVALMQEEGAYFAAYFSCRTAEEVIEEIGRDLKAVARRLGQDDAIPRLSALVAEALAILDAAHDAEARAAGRADYSDADEAAFVALLKAQRPAVLAQVRADIEAGSPAPHHAGRPAGGAAERLDSG